MAVTDKVVGASLLQSELKEAKEYIDAQDSSVKSAVVGTSSDASSASTVYGAKKYASEQASAAVNALDVTDSAATNKYVSAVSQTDGKIAVTHATLPVYSVSAATGSTNGTISVTVNGTASSVAVKGLGSAAYTASTAYDAAGTATTKANEALASAKAYTDSSVSSAYKPQGSCAFADLPALSSTTVGYVYNVTDAFNTTSDFVEGAGGSYPAGTNVVRVDVDGTAKWDCLAGIIDLSPYVKSADITFATASDIGEIF